MWSQYWNPDSPMYEWWVQSGFGDFPLWIMPVMMGIMVLIYIVVEVLLLRYLTKEAKIRRIPYVEFWIVMFLGLNLVGWIVYLIVRDIYPLKEEKKQGM
jgi:UDP-N-acetylmuramyl pentapeptide phosphotransferase/UDP-N-acetylglucosamine-1-phosphate transferase